MRHGADWRGNGGRNVQMEQPDHDAKRPESVAPGKVVTGGEQVGGASRRRRTVESIGELLLLGLVAAFLVYLVVDSIGWPVESALVPRLAGAAAAPLIVIRLYSVLRRTSAPPAQVMDTSFRAGKDPRNEMRRLAGVLAYLCGMWIGIWLFGFHTAVPLSMAIYGRKAAKIGWRGTLVLYVVGLSVIVGLYDLFINARWSEALVYDPVRQLVELLL
jgi:hypothetical protein